MAWENPVTTWGQAGKTVPIADDFNRIEGNILHLEDTKETPAGAQAKAGAVQAELNTHKADDVKHITSAERTNWNGKQDALPVENRRKITFGTADPTGGSDGDIYFQYE